MKKTYFSPRTHYVELSTESLIATSFKVDNSDDHAITGEGGNDAWSQHQNPIWDDWSE